jgi:carboxyl-terminal processing protease
MKTTSRLIVRLAAALFMVSLCTPGACDSGRIQKPTPEQVRERVVSRQPYKIGEDVNVTFPLGKAVQFDCTDNAYFVKKYIVYAADNGMLWMCYFDADGDVVDMRGSDKKNGLRQVVDTPCVAIIRWEIQDQTVVLHFCLSADKQRNQHAYDKAIKARGEWGISEFPPYRAFSHATLPETERLAGFVRLWSEVKFNFANFDMVPELDWDKVLDEYLPKVQQAETREDYLRVLAQCLALLHDGHTDVNYWPMDHLGCYLLPLEVLPLQGKQAVVVRTASIEDVRGRRRKEELVKANLKPGEEITHIDGQSVKAVLERKIYPYICASTPQGRDWKAMEHLFRGSFGSKAVLRVKGLDGAERDVALTRDSYSFPRPPNKFQCRELRDGILYVNLPSFESKRVVDDFQRVFPQVQKAKGLILDVRLNGGGSGSYGHSIISLLTDKPIQTSRWKTRQYVPAFRAWGRKEQWHEEEGDLIRPSAKDLYLGPVVVLTGPGTNSAAEDFVVPLHAGKRATVVGQRTRGSTGQPLPVELPFGIKARVCTKRDMYPDGREFVGVGIIPDVEVQPSAADLAAGRDVVLEKAVQVLKAAR